MKSMILLCAILLGCAGCKDCNKVENPVSPDYPCGTRAHPCSLNPLMCCWNHEVCGGPIGTGCPSGMCCYVGDNYSSPAPSGAASAAPGVRAVPGAASAAPGVRAVPQWSIGTR